MLVSYRPYWMAGLAVLAAVAISGCGKKPAAVVDGRAIERDRFYEIMERASGSQLMVQLISEELVLAEAEKQKVMPDDAEVMRRLNEAKQANPGAFQGLSEEESQRQVRLRLVVRNLALKDVKVSEDEVKKAFEENRRRLDEPEMVVARRAVFKTREEAETARNTLQKAGVAFSVVMDKSIDLPLIRQGGGALPEMIATGDAKRPYVFYVSGEDGQPIEQPAEVLLGAKVAEKLFALPEKGVSEVLACPSPEGFQVLQVDSHRKAKQATLAEWRERVEEQLRLEKRFANERLPQGVDPLVYYQATLIDQLRRKAKIEVNIESLKDLPTREEVWPRLGG